MCVCVCVCVCVCCWVVNCSHKKKELDFVRIIIINNVFYVYVCRVFCSTSSGGD